MKRKWLNVIGAILLTASLTTVSTFAATMPKPWIQNKDYWCWATAAKCVGNNETSFSVPSSYQQVNDQTGLRTEYCGYDSSTGKYIVDTKQEYIVHYCKASDIEEKGHDNLGGSTSNKKNALKLVTGRTTGAYGAYKKNEFSNPTTRATYIDAHLQDGEYVIGDAFHRNNGGHSFVIVAKNDDGTYRIWDPWTNTNTTKTASALFTNGFTTVYDGYGYTHYIECSIYLT